MQAIIMAGGKGRRLRPYTTILPKPLMPIGDIPILEVVIRQLKYYGFTRITFAVGYLAELIQTFFGTGEKWGLEISYSKETKNLGTIGPLSLIEKLDDQFLVMNGDILTDLNYREFYQYHNKSKSLVTIATFRKEVKIDLGVLETDENCFLQKYIEKPTLDYQVSMGIYMMNREILDFIPHNEYLDVPSLMEKLMKAKIPPRAYPFEGRWLDIGRKEDYERAIEEFEAHKTIFLLS